MNRMTPPQAYTREVLAKAYSWLKDQNDETKAKAQTADALVALYLQSLRHKREEKTAQFSSELKSMAKDLPSDTQLELSPIKKDQEAQLPTPPQPTVSADRSLADESITAYRKVEFPPVPAKFKASAEPKAEDTPVATKSIQNLFPPGSFSKAFEEEAEKPQEDVKHEPQAQKASDPEIIKLIEEVSEKLRIQDTEVVHKMLVSIGYEHLMSVFPKK